MGRASGWQRGALVDGTGDWDYVFTLYLRHEHAREFVFTGC
jgi:hypothetical protein